MKLFLNFTGAFKDFGNRSATISAFRVSAVFVTYPKHSHGYGLHNYDY